MMTFGLEVRWQNIYHIGKAKESAKEWRSKKLGSAVLVSIRRVVFGLPRKPKRSKRHVCQRAT